MWAPILSAIGFLIIFVSVLFLVYVTTRYVGNKAGRATKSKNIQVLESVSLGLDKQLHLLKVGETFLLIAASGKNIQFLTTVEMKDYEADSDMGNRDGFDFKPLFDKYLQGFMGKKAGPAEKKTDRDSLDPTEGENFKRNLNRLRTITQKTDSVSKENREGHTNEE